MAAQGGGELATCACGATGVVTERSGRFNFSPWCRIKHENGQEHLVEVYWNGEAFRFRMKEEQ